MPLRTASQANGLYALYPELQHYRDIGMAWLVAVCQPGFLHHAYKNDWKRVSGFHNDLAKLTFHQNIESNSSGGGIAVATFDEKYAVSALPKAFKAAPASYMEGVETEDDVLYAKALPTLDVLNAEEAETVMCYLTAPYLRLPLVFGFFAHPHHFHMLQFPEIQKLLNSVLYEAGVFRAMASAEVLTSLFATRPPPRSGFGVENTDALMPCCGVHYLCFAFVCFFIRSQPPPRSQSYLVSVTSCPPYSHLRWASLFLDFHTSGLYVHHNVMHAFGAPEKPMLIEPVCAQCIPAAQGTAFYEDPRLVP